MEGSLVAGGEWRVGGEFLIFDVGCLMEERG